MRAFGRRNSRALQVAASSAPERTVVSRAPIALAVLIGAFAVFQDPARQLYADRKTPLPRNLAAGFQVAAAPYAPPAGCPSRQWMEGDYLPVACFAGQRIDHEYGEQIGLERPLFVGKTKGRRKWRGFRQREWVRAGGDALLLTRPKDASGKILYIARGRFEGSTSAFKSEGQDYRKPPADYIVRSAVNLAFVPIAVLGVIGAVLLYLRIRPAKPPGG